MATRGTQPGVPFTGQSTFQVIVQGTNREFAFSTTSGVTGTFSTGVNVVRIYCSSDAYVQFGTNPSAATGSLHIVAGIPEYFGVIENYKVAVMQVASAGTCQVTEGSV